MITSIHHTLCGLDAEVDVGPVTAIIGRNGSGKSAILNAIQFAHSGRLEWPAGDRRPARTPADVGAALLPSGGGAGRVDVRLSSGDVVTRTLRRRVVVEPDGSESQTCSIGLEVRGAGPAPRVKPTKSATEGALRRVLPIDPLAYSLAPWLERSQPERVRELLSLAAARDPSDEDLAEALGSLAADAECVRALRAAMGEDGVQGAIDAAHDQVVALQRQRTDLQRLIEASQSEAVRLGGAHRTLAEIERALAHDRAQLVAVEGELAAYATRARDHGQAEERVATEAAALDQARRDYELLRPRYQAAVTRIREIQAATYELADAGALELAADLAEDEAADAEALDGRARDLLTTSIVRHAEAVERLRHLEGQDRALRVLVELPGLCACGRETVERARVSAARAVVDAEGAVALAQTDRDARAAESDTARSRAVEARERAREERRALEAASARNTAIAARRAREEQELATLREVTAREDALRRAGEAAAARVKSAEADLARLVPGAHHVELLGRAAGLRLAVAAEEAERTARLDADRLSARLLEQAAERDAVEAQRAAWSEAHGRLVALRVRLLSDGLRPLDEAADRLYHAATGGHVRFVAERGGVDVALADGSVRPLEACSGGEGLEVVPALMAALQRARGCAAPLVLLDGLERCDRRFDLLRACAELRARGEVGQVICTWTAMPEDVASEIARASRIEGVTVVALRGDRGGRAAA